MLVSRTIAAKVLEALLGLGTKLRFIFRINTKYPNTKQSLNPNFLQPLSADRAFYFSIARLSLGISFQSFWRCQFLL